LKIKKKKEHCNLSKLKKKKKKKKKKKLKTRINRTFFAMVKNDKAAASNEAAECTMEVLDTYAPASISIEWGEQATTNTISTHLIFLNSFIYSYRG
jgi:hypothetical protein